jgi:hypothetical protein
MFFFWEIHTLVRNIILTSQENKSIIIYLNRMLRVYVSCQFETNYYKSVGIWDEKGIKLIPNKTCEILEKLCVALKVKDVKRFIYNCYHYT